MLSSALDTESQTTTKISITDHLKILATSDAKDQETYANHLPTLIEVNKHLRETNTVINQLESEVKELHLMVNLIKKNHDSVPKKSIRATRWHARLISYFSSYSDYTGQVTLVEGIEYSHMNSIVTKNDKINQYRKLQNAFLARHDDLTLLQEKEDRLIQRAILSQLSRLKMPSERPATAPARATSSASTSSDLIASLSPLTSLDDEDTMSHSAATDHKEFDREKHLDAERTMVIEMIEALRKEAECSQELYAQHLATSAELKALKISQAKTATQLAAEQDRCLTLQTELTQARTAPVARPLAAPALQPAAAPDTPPPRSLMSTLFNSSR